MRKKSRITEFYEGNLRIYIMMVNWKLNQLQFVHEGRPNQENKNGCT